MLDALAWAFILLGKILSVILVLGLIGVIIVFMIPDIGNGIDDPTKNNSTKKDGIDEYL